MPLYVGPKNSETLRPSPRRSGHQAGEARKRKGTFNPPFYVGAEAPAP